MTTELAGVEEKKRDPRNLDSVRGGRTLVRLVIGRSSSHLIVVKVLLFSEKLRSFIGDALQG